MTSVSTGERLAEIAATLSAHLKECGDKSASLQKTMDQVFKALEQLHERISKAREDMSGVRDGAREDRKQDIKGVLDAMREERETWSDAMREERGKRERLTWWAVGGMLGLSATVIGALIMAVVFFMTGGTIKVGG